MPMHSPVCHVWELLPGPQFNAQLGYWRLRGDFSHWGPDYKAICEKEDADLGSNKARTLGSATFVFYFGFWKEEKEEKTRSCANYGCTDKYIKNHPCQWVSQLTSNCQTFCWIDTDNRHLVVWLLFGSLSPEVHGQVLEVRELLPGTQITERTERTYRQSSPSSWARIGFSCERCGLQAGVFGEGGVACWSQVPFGARMESEEQSTEWNLQNVLEYVNPMHVKNVSLQRFACLGYVEGFEFQFYLV